MKLFFACCAFLMIFCLAGAEKLQVIYIHGWDPAGDGQYGVAEKLQKIFPDAEISLHEWNAGSKDFRKSVAVADKEAVKLAEKLAAQPDEKLQNVILVGHSLGGRITIRSMAYLANRGKKIRQGIFLGSAIFDDDADISKAITASLQPNINIYNRQDYVLRHVYLAYNLSFKRRKTALGAFGYAYECKTSQLRQKGMADDSSAITKSDYIKRIKKHSSMEYLDFLEHNFSALNAGFPEKIDSSTAKGKVKISTGSDGGEQIPLPDELSLLAGSKILDSEKNWRLLHFKTYIRKKQEVWGKTVNVKIPVNIYYIVDNRDHVVYYNVFYQNAKKEFDLIKGQL